MRRLLLVALLWPAVAIAQPVHVPGRTITLAAQAIDTQPIWFVGRAVPCTVVSTSVELKRPPGQADASPSAIIGASPIAGCNVDLKLTPNSGCATSGCRAGNNYQVTVQVEDANGNRPVGSILVRVRQEDLGQ